MTKRVPEKLAARPEQEDEVADFLLSHPDFFEEHVDLLLELRVPHPSGGAVSLIERRVEMLREELHQSRKKLNHLVCLAKDNDALSARLHRLTLALILGKDFEHLQTSLKSHLQEDFGADAVRLILFPAERLRTEASADATQADQASLVVNEFLDFMETRRPVCGNLRQEQLETLFPEQNGSIRSAALVPVDAGEVMGILAIGSHDEDRFRPNMGTDFLLRLGEILGHKLRTLPLPGV